MDGEKKFFDFIFLKFSQMMWLKFGRAAFHLSRITPNIWEKRRPGSCLKLFSVFLSIRIQKFEKISISKQNKKLAFKRTILQLDAWKLWTNGKYENEISNQTDNSSAL